MINRLLLFVILGLLSSSLYAQTETLNISGLYYNENIFLYNPSVGENFSIQSLKINDYEVKEDLSANGIELDLKSYGLKEKMPVKITIVYSAGYLPRVVNPEVIRAPERFRITKPRYTRNSELQWAIRGAPSDKPIIVEQFKWNVWREIAVLNHIDTIALNLYEVKIEPHSGKNIFRIKGTDVKGEEITSRKCYLSSKDVRTVEIQNKKIRDEIVLSAKTEYEIYTLEEE
ncbi:MAG: hypothetical protein KAG84_07175, partial [Bacteroidales bacterium]|nr:hypothetical protein [Bacteroidales bacterium]